MIPALSQGTSNDILLVHAATTELGETGYRYSSDVTVDYIAEFLWGLLDATDGFADAQVDFESEANAHSLADIYYDPEHADLKATIGSGYQYVILLESEQGSAYPEMMYEGCRQLSQTVLDAGGTPLLMMNYSDHVDTELYGEYTYRAANGCGVEVVPAGYAMELAGLQGKQVAEARAKQAWLSACAIYAKITGLDPAGTGYAPSYTHQDWSNDYYKMYLSGTDITTLRHYAVDAVETHSTNEHYKTSYELDGSVVYRTMDVSGTPFNDVIRYFYKGTSTHDFTAERLNVIITNNMLTAAETKIGKLNYDTRDWTTNDLANRAATFATYADEGLFLYVGGTDEGANAQDIIDLNQANLVPMVFDWIKGFDGYTGTASTTAALNNQDCADLWDHYHKRGWKTIPLTVGLGRLNEKIQNLAASDDDLHLSDPMVYMNASMMLASSLGTQLSIPDTLPIRRGSWTHAQLTTAIETGHDLVKELAFMSETSAFVPDSDLSILTDELPGIEINRPYSQQLSATGGVGSYTWELASSAGLPTGLTLSSSGVLSGTVSDGFGTLGVAFKVTDGEDAFRKAGFKLRSDLPIGDITSGTDILAATANNYGTDAIATIYSDVLTAPDELATFRIAIDVDPMAGTSITSAGGLWGINSGEAASGWWNTFDGSLTQSVDSVANIHIVDFNANGGNLTVDDFSDLSFQSITVHNAHNASDRVKVVAGDVANAAGGLKMAASPETIDLQALAGSDSVASFTLANGNVGNSKDRWNIGSIHVSYTITMPAADEFSAWASRFSLTGNDALRDADSIDQDGYDNLAEFALGMNPTNSDAGSMESVGTRVEGGTNWFEYVHSRRTDYAGLGLSYLLIDSTNLVESIAATNAQDQILVGPTAAGFEPVTNRYVAEGPAKFFQLMIRQD
ncbi:Ig domain-containing protein [Pontiellaceae bacterium B1224]|nr:Ig domain-containing protein [Pontiellaceae bacterium B1224]